MYPEMLILVGSIVVIGSLVAFLVANATKAWFFTPDLRSEVLVAANSVRNRREDKRQRA